MVVCAAVACVCSLLGDLVYDEHHCLDWPHPLCCGCCFLINLFLNLTIFFQIVTHEWLGMHDVHRINAAISVRVSNELGLGHLRAAKYATVMQSVMIGMVCMVYVPGVLACSAHAEKGENVAVSVAIEQPGADGGWGVGFTCGTLPQGSQRVTDEFVIVAYPFHSERSGLYFGQGISMMSRHVQDTAELLEGEICIQDLPSIITAHALVSKGRATRPRWGLSVIRRIRGMVKTR